MCCRPACSRKYRNTSRENSSISRKKNKRAEAGERSTEHAKRFSNETMRSDAGIFPDFPYMNWRMPTICPKTAFAKSSCAKKQNRDAHCAGRFPNKHAHPNRERKSTENTSSASFIKRRSAYLRKATATDTDRRPVRIVISNGPADFCPEFAVCCTGGSAPAISSSTVLPIPHRKSTSRKTIGQVPYRSDCGGPTPDLHLPR